MSRNIVIMKRMEGGETENEGEIRRTRRKKFKKDGRERGEE